MQRGSNENHFKKLGITDDIEIDCGHHMGKFQKDKLKPQTVVCKFLGSEDKKKFLQNAKKLKAEESSFMKNFLKQRWNCENLCGKKIYSIGNKTK